MNQTGYQDLLNTSVIDADSLIINILTLPNLDANSVAIIDVDNNLSDILLTNGQVVIGSNGNAPVGSTLTGTTDEVIVTNGPGSITLSTPQPIATTSSPTFNDLTLTSLNSVPIGDYIVTPSTSDLDMNSHDISNVGDLNGTPVSDYFVTPANQDLNMNSHDISNLNAILGTPTIPLTNCTGLPISTGVSG